MKKSLFVFVLIATLLLSSAFAFAKITDVNLPKEAPLNASTSTTAAVTFICNFTTNETNGTLLWSIFNDTTTGYISLWGNWNGTNPNLNGTLMVNNTTGPNRGNDGQGNVTFVREVDDGVWNWSCKAQENLSASRDKGVDHYINDTGNYTFIQNASNPVFSNPVTNVSGMKKFIMANQTVNMSFIINKSNLNTSRVNITVVNGSDTDNEIANYSTLCVYANDAYNSWNCSVDFVTWGNNSNYTFKVTAWDNNSRMSNVTASQVKESVWFVVDSMYPRFSNAVLNATSQKKFLMPNQSVNLSIVVNDTYLNLSMVNLTVWNASDITTKIVDVPAKCVPNGVTGSWNCSGEFVTWGNNTNYTYNVTAYDNASNSNMTNVTLFSAASNWFVVDSTYPVFANASTNATNEKKYLMSGQTINLSVTVNDTYLNLSQVNITVVNASATSKEIENLTAQCIQDGTAGSWICSAQYTPTSQNSNFTFNVTAYDNASNSNVSLATNLTSRSWFVADSTSPAFTNAVLNATSQKKFLMPNQSVTLNITINDTSLNLSQINITVVNASATGMEIQNLTGACVASGVADSWNCSAEFVTWGNNTNYTYNVTGYDNASNTGYKLAATWHGGSWFVVDSTNPVSTNPVTNATNQKKYVMANQSINLSIIVNDTYLNLSMVNITVVNASATSKQIDNLTGTCVPNGATSSWTCSANFVTWGNNTNYTYNVTAYDNASNTNYTFAPARAASAWFVVDSTIPASTNPVTNATNQKKYIMSGQKITLNMTVNDTYLNLSMVNITVVNASATTQEVENLTAVCVASGVTSSWNCSASYTPTSQNSNLTYKATAYDNASNTNYTIASAENNAWFVADSTVPVFSNAAMNLTDHYININETVNISFVVNDTYLNKSTINITIVNASDTTKEIANSTASCVPLAAGSFNCSAEFQTFGNNSNYTFKALAYDNASNLGSKVATVLHERFWFYADSNYPTVNYTTPGTGNLGVGLNNNITVVFSEIMNDTTLNNTTFYLNTTTGAAVVARIITTIDNRSTTWVLDPLNALTCGTTYNATIRTLVGDLTDHTMQTQYTWTFTTESCGGGEVTTTSAGGGGAGGAVAPTPIEFTAAVDAAGAAVEAASVSMSVGTTLAVPMETATAGGEAASEQHTIKLKEIGSGYAVVTIASTPTEYTLRVNSPKYVDLNGDAISDLKLLLTGTSKTSVDITVTKLSEGFAAAKKVEAVETTPAAVEPVVAEPAAKEPVAKETAVTEMPAKANVPVWAYWLIGAVIVIAIGAYIFAQKKPKAQQ